MTIPHMRSLLFALSLALGGTVSTVMADVVAGPKGGRLLEAQPAPAEFVVNSKGQAEIHFYDERRQPVAPTTQVVAVTAEAPTGRTVLALDKTETGFVSRDPLPEGAPYRVVVQIRPSPGEKPQNFRIDLNLAVCGGCSLAEYACTCEGH